MPDAHHTTLYTTARRGALLVPFGVLACFGCFGSIGNYPLGQGPVPTPLPSPVRLLDIAMWHHAISCPGYSLVSRGRGTFVSAAPERYGYQ